MSEVLEFLFGSKSKTRLLRFFLLNPSQECSVAEISKKNKLDISKARQELARLKKINFVVEKIKKGKKHYLLNSNFAYYPELKNLIIKSNIYPQCRSLGGVKGIGNVKLALVSGVFLNYTKSKADILIVADNVSRAKLKHLMANLEAEIGKEISYVHISDEEFKYRLNMLDRFILDFLEGPHEEVINKVPGLRRYINGLKNN